MRRSSWRRSECPRVGFALSCLALVLFVSALSSTVYATRSRTTLPPYPSILLFFSPRVIERLIAKDGSLMVLEEAAESADSEGGEGAASADKSRRKKDGRVLGVHPNFVVKH